MSKAKEILNQLPEAVDPKTRRAFADFDDTVEPALDKLIAFLKTIDKNLAQQVNNSYGVFLTKLIDIEAEAALLSSKGLDKLISDKLNAKKAKWTK